MYRVWFVCYFFSRKGAKNAKAGCLPGVTKKRMQKNYNTKTPGDVPGADIYFDQKINPLCLHDDEGLPGELHQPVLLPLLYRSLPGNQLQ